MFILHIEDASFIMNVYIVNDFSCSTVCRAEFRSKEELDALQILRMQAG